MSTAEPRTQRLPVQRRHAPRPRWWWGVAGVVVALAVVGVAARMLADYEWNEVVEYESPYVFDLPRGEPTRRLAGQVVLVVVDGLRSDTARDLPNMRRLGEEGSLLVARTSEPSLSLPGWTALTTGAPPAISGVTTNWYEGRVRVGSVLEEAKAEGLTTAVAGHRAWGRLFGDLVDHTSYVGDERVADRAVGRGALEMLAEDDPDLLILHLPDVDNRGHESGVGRAYRRAARRADRIVGRVAEAAGPDTALIVTSDHGHIDEGGHGGPEEVVKRTPLVLSGDGLVPGASGEISQSDVAPTIAALLGIPRPAHATGQLRVSLLDASERRRENIQAAHDEVSARFYARATEVVNGSGETPQAFERARQDRMRHDVLSRLPIALAVLGAAALALAFASQRLDGAAVLAGVATFFLVWAALFFGRGLTFSFSHFNTEEQVDAFLWMRLLDAVLALLAASVVTGLIAGRRGRAHPIASGLGTAAWIMFVIGLPVAVFLTIFGWASNWRLPELSAGFGQFLALLAMFGVGVAAAVAALLAWGVAWAVAPRGERAAAGPPV